MSTSTVVFLLGAGASINAGVPDTFEFVNRFRSHITSKDDKKTVKKIVGVLEKWKGAPIDIELLLETLMKLANKDQEPLLRFYTNANFILEGYPQKQPLIDQLKDFIKEQATVNISERVSYLQPLRGFIEDSGTLDIITVNYDTCIEHFCSINRLVYTDGFTDRWYPEAFETAGSDVRLYKLHGSVLWYRGDDYIKSPIMTSGSEVRLFTGEQARSLMLYPVQKLDYSGPILELLMRVKSLLQAKSCKFLVVVGYSFRDEQIRALLFDVARKNKDLILVLIDPKALNIYQNMLLYLDKGLGIPSPLSGRVVCLPYKFETIFPLLRNQYLTNLNIGLAVLANSLKEEIRGGQVKWFAGLEDLAKSEYLEKLQYVIENKIDHEMLAAETRLYITIMVRFIANNAAGNNTEESGKWLRKLKQYLLDMMLKGVNLNILPGWLDVEVSNTGNLMNILQEQERYLLSVSNLTSGKALSSELGFIQNVINYIAIIPQKISFEKYVQSRLPYIDTAQKELLDKRAEDFRKSSSEDVLRELTSKLIEIEKKYIVSLFG